MRKYIIVTKERNVHGSRSKEPDYGLLFYLIVLFAVINFVLCPQSYYFFLFFILPPHFAINFVLPILHNMGRMEWLYSRGFAQYIYFLPVRHVYDINFIQSMTTSSSLKIILDNLNAYFR